MIYKWYSIWKQLIDIIIYVILLKNALFIEILYTIYHIKNVNNFEKIKTSLSKTNFQLIMFLNKMLFTTKKTIDLQN